MRSPPPVPIVGAGLVLLSAACGDAHVRYLPAEGLEVTPVSIGVPSADHCTDVVLQLDAPRPVVGAAWRPGVGSWQAVRLPNIRRLWSPSPMQVSIDVCPRGEPLDGTLTWYLEGGGEASVHIYTADDTGGGS